MTPHETSIPCICGDPNCTIPYGTCHCGCGAKTTIARANCTLYKWKKGLPKKYIGGHWKTKKTVVGCVCGKTDCAVPFGYCHCGCGEKTEIAKRSSRRYNTRPGYPNVYCPSHMNKINPSDICICGNINCTIPYGYCHCGCGEKTRLAKQSNSKLSYRNGEPFMFLPTHHLRYKPNLEDAVPFKINGVYCRLIPLTQGLHAIVDASDYEWLMQWKWLAQKNSCSKKFYAQRTDWRNGKRVCIAMHRLVLGLAEDDPLFADHINRVSLDNRRKNLRPATCSENQFNKVMSTTTSGRKGVNWSKRSNKWIARICANRMMIDLGSSESFEEACLLREEGERLYHGKFACAG